MVNLVLVTKLLSQIITSTPENGRVEVKINRKTGPRIFVKLFLNKRVF